MATGIGDILRNARREQGATLADAAAQTRVRETYLAALEEEEFAALGGDVYVKGFLRSYAKYLGLDPEPLLTAYRREHEGADEPAPVAAAPVAPVQSERQPGIMVVAGVAAVLLLLLAVIGIAGRDDPAVPEDQAVAPAPVTTTAPPTTEPAEPDVDPEPETEPEAEPVEGVEVVVTVTGSAAWMRVEVDGQNVFEGEESNGFTQTFQGDEEVTLRIGDPAAVSIVFNGEDQGELGSPGQPVNLTYQAEATA
jgi:cytoskeleton protein RodZ